MSEKPVQVGSDRQLFLDELWFDSQENIRLRMHNPVAREVALSADEPWESGGVHYSTVIEDDGRYRIWYRCDIGAGPENRDGESMTCYTESTDGITWDKPNLGLIEWAGSRANNIIFPTDDLRGINASVIRDPNGAPGGRYKMITRERTKPVDAILGSVSDDGIHWTRTGPHPILTGRPFDSHNILLWDEASERYIIYMRGHSTSVAGTFGPTKNGHRSVRRSESADFLNWSEPETVIESDDGDPPGLHFYTNSGLKYGRAANAFLMFPMILYPERVHPSAPIPGLSDIQMATSRDGVTWKRRFREPYIRPGLDLRNWVDRNPIMGRGNGFAAMGLTESLTYMPEDHPDRTRVLTKFVALMEAMRKHQEPSGMWRQVVNFPGTYQEFTATSMTGYAMARGVRMGWLDEGFRDTVALAWQGISERIEDSGKVVDACFGSGTNADVQYYLDRPAVSGFDDRGGSMALSFTVEMLRTLSWPGLDTA